MKWSFLLFVIMLIFLAGCSQEGQNPGLTKKDLSIEKVGDSKAKVEYGMERSDVEKVLGKGEKMTMGIFSYGSGVKIMYRNDKVAGISLDREAVEIYQTPKIKVGMLKADIKKVYGEEHILFEAEKNIDYAYDTKEGAYLTQESKRKENAEELEDVLMVFVTFDDNGYAERIMLLDQRMAILMN